MDKKALRRAIGEKKRAMSLAQVEAASARLAEKLFATDEWRAAESIYAYLSFNQEIRTEPIIRRAWEEGKRVAVPKVVGKDMVFLWIENFDALSPSAFGVPEPIADTPVADDPNALVLMPGLAFDPEGHRVGYGGGYYDRFLERETHHPLIALCFGFQLLPHLDTESHDIPVHRVIADEVTNDVM